MFQYRVRHVLNYICFVACSPFFIADTLNLVDATLYWYDLNKNKITCLLKKIITLELNVTLTLTNPNSDLTLTLISNTDRFWGFVIKLL